MVQLISKRKQQRRVSINFDLIRQNRQTVFIFLILLFVLLVYGLLFFYGGILNKELLGIDAEIKNLREGRDADKEDAVLQFDAKLKRLGLILDNHIYSSNIFTFIEGLTHPKVQFTNFAFASGSGKLTLGGLTESYETFGEQTIALERSGKVKNLVISNVKLQKTGQVEFTVAFDIDEDVYK